MNITIMKINSLIVLFFLVVLSSCVKEQAADVIEDLDPLTVEIISTDVQVDENSKEKIVIELKLSRIIGKSIKVFFDIKGKDNLTGYTLSVDNDIKLLNKDKVVVIPAGKTTANIELIVNDNNIIDKDRAAELTLLSCDEPVKIGLKKSSSILVIDNENAFGGLFLRDLIVFSGLAFETCDETERVSIPYEIKLIKEISEDKIKVSIKGMGNVFLNIQTGWAEAGQKIEYLPVECIIDNTNPTRPCISMSQQPFVKWYKEENRDPSIFNLVACNKKPIKLDVLSKKWSFDYSIYDDRLPFFTNYLFTVYFDLN
ncbi:MAG: hypothetical protein WBG43_09460 [Marinifilaceae bacterium]